MSKLTHKQFTSIRNLITDNARIYGDKPQYVYKRKKNEIKFTYNDALDTFNAIGTAFSGLGLLGKTVAVIGETDPYYVMTYYATVAGNGVIVPLDKEISEEEIFNFINLSGAEAIVYTSQFNNVLAPEEDKIPNVKYFIPIDGEGENCESKKVLSMQSLLDFGHAALSAGNTAFLDVETDLEKMCAIIFTSGTTGTSKGVMLCERNLIAAGNAASQLISMVNSDTNLLCVLPINHTYEMTCSHIASCNKGTTTYINESLKYVARNMQKVQPTALVLVPLFVETLAKKIWANIEAKGMTEKVRKGMKLTGFLRKFGIDVRRKVFAEVHSAFGGNLSTIISGGAKLDADYIRDFDAFGIEILEGYGITECSPLVSVNIPTAKKLGTVGKPVPGCQVKTDAEDERSEGEILVKGDNVMLGYFNNPEATAEVFTEDGWFKTGDIGTIDKEGFISITGRKKNIIILSNGKNIYPEEIEQYLAKIEEIAECVVIGKENSAGDVVITAVIYPNTDKYQDADMQTIHDDLKAKINEVNKQLPIFKQIREIQLRDTEFEKTPSRKIKRYKVK